MKNKENLFFITGIVIVTTLYILFSLVTYKDYGITADEELEYKGGRALLQYYKAGTTPQDINLQERHLPENSTYFRGHLVISNLLNPNGYYEQFHFLNIIYALPIFIVLYLFLYFEYRKVCIALLGPLFLFLTPRFSGDIPANPKDVPFAIVFLISVLLIYIGSKAKVYKGSILKYAVLGVLFGLAQSFRTVGFSLHIIYFSYALISGLKKDLKLSEILKSSAVIFLVSIIVMVLLLPLLHTNLLNGFQALLASSQDFSFWNNKILYFGEFLTKDQRPLTYLPVWIAITTPLFTLLPLLASPVVFAIRKERSNLFSLLVISLLVNLALYFIINPVIYNGLRHFLYLLPVMALISVITIVEIFSLFNGRVKILVAVPLLLLMFLTTKDMKNLHPYEYIYFNEIVGGMPGAQGKFDLDYWGSSYTEGSIWIRENLTSGKDLIKVYPCDLSFAVDYYSHKKFEVVGSKKDADYIICDFDNSLTSETGLDIIKIVQRNGVPLNYVTKTSRE